MGNGAEPEGKGAVGGANRPDGANGHGRDGRDQSAGTAHGAQGEAHARRGGRARQARSGEACRGEGGAVELFGSGRRLPGLGVPVGEAVGGEECGCGEAAAAEAAGAGVSGELGPAFQDAPRGEKANREPRGRPYATPGGDWGPAQSASCRGPPARVTS